MSNAPWAASGYGTTTLHTIRALRDAGHDPAVCAFWGQEGGITEWEGFRVYPKGLQPYSVDIGAAHCSHWCDGPGVLVSLIDIWVMSGMAQPMKDATHSWVSWFMVDQAPLIHDCRNVLKYVDFPVAPSRWGQMVTQDAGFACDYIPLPVDTTLMQPRDRAESRARLNLPPDAYVFGMVAANKCPLGRKGWAQAIEAFSMFCREHDDAYLYLHTEPMPVHGGWNIAHIAEVVGVPANRVIIADRYGSHVGFDADHMSHVFSAMDCLLSPSLGEGFGVPIVEAQACGTPVIAGAWTSMQELVGDGSILIDPVDTLRWMTPQGGFWHIPQPGAILDAMRDMYQRPRLDAAVVRDAALPYDARVVVQDYWLPLLDRVAESRKERELVPPEVEVIAG